MEDIDPPREMAGADKLILSTLEQHGLHWDGAVLYQSTRHARYREVLDDLLARGQIYRCACTRARLISLHRVYDGYCRQHPPPADAACALRLQLPEKSVVFDDRIQGVQVQHLAEAGDCIIHRKDGLFAYQLAVVVDDAAQGVTEVVRGADLIDSTARQIFLQQTLGLPTPAYAHLPLALDAEGRKLGKSQQALALDPSDPIPALRAAWAFLGQPPATLANVASLPRLLDAAIAAFDPGRVPSHDLRAPRTGT